MEYTFPWMGGHLVDNFETLGAVSDKTWTVPTGRRWLIISAYAERDQNATLIMAAYNSADKLLWYLHGSQVSIAAGTTNINCYTNITVDKTSYIYGMPFPIILKAGDYVKYTWGAAQTTPEVHLNVVEIDEP